MLRTGLTKLKELNVSRAAVNTRFRSCAFKVCCTTPCSPDSASSHRPSLNTDTVRSPKLSLTRPFVAQSSHCESFCGTFAGRSDRAGDFATIDSIGGGGAFVVAVQPLTTLT